MVHKCEYFDTYRNKRPFRLKTVKKECEWFNWVYYLVYFASLNDTKAQDIRINEPFFNFSLTLIMNIV